MSGHYGSQSATVLNQVIVKVDATKNYILVKGGVPGPKLSIVKIRSAIKDQLGTKPTVSKLVDRSENTEATNTEAK